MNAVTVEKWLHNLAVNPVPRLLGKADPALEFFVRKDLLDETVGVVETLWQLDEPLRLAARQQPNGSWRYPGKSYDPRNGTNYDLLETYRNLRVLVEMYGFHRNHWSITKAADYIFSYQTEEGDIRGILGNQYMPYYHGAILELMIKAGYSEDPRAIQGLNWLLTMRQQDGGWIVPAQAIPAKSKTSEFWLGKTLPPDRNRPSSHLATGMALRAFVENEEFCRRPEVLTAGELLKSRLFQPDRFNDRKAPSYWFKFQYPFWWTSLLTALDTLGKLDFSGADEIISRGVQWFKSNQQADGLWGTDYDKGRNAYENRLWVGLAVCRVLRRLDP